MRLQGYDQVSLQVMRLNIMWIAALKIQLQEYALSLPTNEILEQLNSDYW